MKESKIQKPTGTCLKPQFQVMIASNHRSVTALKIAADSPEQARKTAEHIVAKSLLVYPAQELGIPETVIDTVASTKLAQLSVVNVKPALKEGGLDLSNLSESLEVTGKD